MFPAAAEGKRFISAEPELEGDEKKRCYDIPNGRDFPFSTQGHVEMQDRCIPERNRVKLHDDNCTDQIRPSGKTHNRMTHFTR